MPSTKWLGYVAIAVVALLSGCSTSKEAPEQALEEGAAGMSGASSDDAEVAVVSQALTAPDTSCTLKTFGGINYYFCSNDRNYATAKTKCEAVGFKLARIDSAAENTFVDQNTSSDRWLGGTDVVAEGVWRWEIGGTQFWQGAGNGSPVGGAYTNFSSGLPNNSGNRDCLQMQGNGKWIDDSCSNSEDYVCEEIDTCLGDPNKMNAGQCGCGNPDTDSDGDGTANCNDPCRQDATKLDPGVCGCGTADTDSDSDGTPNCEDLCPSDAARIEPGDCGCANAPKPAGTTCDDGLCVANNQCNGAGRCGSPAQCTTPDSDCEFGMHAGSMYWFCDNDRSFANARSRCQSVNMDLVVIESANEDDYVTDSISEHSFIGGSDAATEGTWLWLASNTPFWSGGPSGSAVGGAYTNWQGGDEPSQSSASNDCIAKEDSGDGEWESHSCSTGDAFVCERADACPDDPSKITPGLCGCGQRDVDTDGDGTPDCEDECEWDPERIEAGDEGCDTPTCVAGPSSLTPIFDCVLERPDGSSAAVFYVQNASACVVTVPSGTTNQFASAPAFRGQPTVFEPGLQYALTTPITGPLSWTLGSTTATASLSGPACEAFTELIGSAVELNASIAHPSNVRTDGHKTSSEPIVFEIPKRLNVSAGNAANAGATFSFRNGGGPVVTCSYQGGSSSATPVGELEFARGRAFQFVSCSNGALGGSTATATQWDLAVLGGDPRLPATVVGSHVGPGCGGTLEPAVTPEQTVQLKTGFSWTTTTALPETTSEPGVATPLPAMYYAMIYVDDPEDIESLEQAGVLFNDLPLFPSELDPYDGHCGTVDNTGDLRGHFVFSLIPGTVYNYIRGLSIGAGVTPLFQAIVLRTIPEGYLRNPDGTMSWRRAIENHMSFPTDETQGISSFGLIPSIIADIRNKIETAVATVRAAIAEAARTDVKIRLRFTPYNRDNLFVYGTKMARGWGPANTPRPHGVRVQVLYSGAAGTNMGYDAMNEYGKAVITVPKGRDVRTGAVCIHEKNEFGSMLVGSSSEQKLCDFAYLRSHFDGFKRDFPRQPLSSHAPRAYHDIGHDDKNLAILTQVTDGNDYMRRVVGKRLARGAKINVGYVANVAGLFNSNRAFTPCFGYSSMSSFVEQLARDELNDVVEFFVDVFTLGTADDGLDEGIFRMDMYLPSVERINDSRALATHELGHFVMCDLFNEDGQLRALYSDRAAEDFEEEADDIFGLAMESFADFFASQVASAVNYPDLAQDATASLSSEFCSNHDCLEHNYRGTTAENEVYNDQILRFVSTYYDAFDTQQPWRDTPNDEDPNNSDGWKVIGPPEIAVFIGGGGTEDDYEPDHEDDDEVMLPGEAIDVWLDYAAPLLQGSSPGIAMRRALAKTMDDYSANWCQICEVFAQHEPGAGGASVLELWKRCVEGETEDIVGPPPQEDLRMDSATCAPCGPNEGSDEDGVCFFCDPEQRKVLEGPDCVQCPDGSIALPDQTCSACLATQITDGNTCVDCPYPEHANRATNTCEGCAIDGVVDVSTFDINVCGAGFFDVQVSSNPDDICPNEFWVDIENIDALAADGSAPSSLSLGTVAFGPDLPLVGCGGGIGVITQTNFRDADLGPAEETFVDIEGANECGPGSGFPCVDECLYDFYPLRSITAEEIEETGLRSMRVRLQTSIGPGDVTHQHVFVTAPDLCPGPI